MGGEHERAVPGGKPLLGFLGAFSAGVILPHAAIDVPNLASAMAANANGGDPETESSTREETMRVGFVAAEEAAIAAGREGQAAVSLTLNPKP